MNLLIPCAGEGKRFQDAGYDLPKPIIEISNGKLMLEKAIEDFDDISRAIFIFRSSHYHKYPEHFDSCMEELSKICPVQKILVNFLTEGAACTALLAKELIDDSSPLWITDCDHLISDPDYSYNARHFFGNNNANAGLLCHLADHPKWSYTRVKDKQAIEIIEKQVISDLANTGDYYFEKGSDFVEAAERMISKNDRTKGEFYISGVYSYLIADGKKVMPYMVNDMVGLGTPEDLKKYQDGCAKFSSS